MRRFPVLLASSVLCALLSVGCKQGIGGRCEQNSDCASGYCSGATQTSIAGGKCQGGPTAPDVDAAPPPVDATPADTGAEAGGDASDAADAALEPSPDTGVDLSPAEVAVDSTGG